MEQIWGINCNQIFSGAPYLVQKDQGHLVTSGFCLRDTVPGTKSSGAFWILITHPNLGNGRETQDIGCCKTSTGISTAHPVRQTECSIVQYLIHCSFAFGYEMIVKLISTQLAYYIFKTSPQKTRTWYILLQTVCWIIQRYVSRNTIDARNICTKCTVRQVYNKCAL